MSLARDAMYAAFEKTPGDLAGYAAMSDELRELGYEALAHAFKWMSARGKCPMIRGRYAGKGHSGRLVPQSVRWAWYSQRHWADKARKIEGATKEAIERAALPSMILPNDQKTFPSHQAAVMWLAVQLDWIRDIWVAEAPFGTKRLDSSNPTDIRKAPLFEEPA